MSMSGIMTPSNSTPQQQGTNQMREWKVSPQEVEAGDCQAHCYCSELEWMTGLRLFETNW
jgi:hypothetical protein